MSKKITWTKQSIFQYFCWYLLISSIVNVVVIAILSWKNCEFHIAKNFDGTIATILSVLGVFIAFTAISIYSVFNARVEDEKQKLEEVRAQCYKDLANFDERINDYYKEFSELDKKIDNHNLYDSIFDVKNSVVLLDKVRAIYALSELIEKNKKRIDETDSIREKERLKEDLSSLKIIIKREIEPYYCKLEEIKNNTFKGIFNDFKALLDEESVV